MTLFVVYLKHHLTYVSKVPSEKAARWFARLPAFIKYHLDQKPFPALADEREQKKSGQVSCVPAKWSGRALFTGSTSIHWLPGLKKAPLNADNSTKSPIGTCYIWQKQQMQTVVRNPSHSLFRDWFSDQVRQRRFTDSEQRFLDLIIKSQREYYQAGTYLWPLPLSNQGHG